MALDRPMVRVHGVVPAAPRITVRPRKGDIQNGPSKFYFMVSLFDGKVVTFTVEHRGEVHVRINKVEREDGSGESWIIGGFVIPRDGSSYQPFEGYYQTRDRKGWFEL